MRKKPTFHEDVYEIYNDVSSLHLETHQHSSRAILRQISHLKQVRFDSSPPEVFEYEALDPENLPNDNHAQIYLGNVGHGALSGEDSLDSLEVDNHSRTYEGELSPSEGNPLTLPIPNRREIFELENYPSDLNHNVHAVVEPLRADVILSIDGKYIQKSTLSDTTRAGVSRNDAKLTEPNSSWMDLKDIKLEIDKIAIEREGLSQDCLASKHFQPANSQFESPDFIDMQSTTESLSFLWQTHICYQEPSAFDQVTALGFNLKLVCD